MSILLAAGASAAATDEDGKTPLVWAASQGHEAAVGQHVEKRRLGRVPAACPPLRFGRSILQIDTACARCMHAGPGRGCRVGRCSTAQAGVLDSHSIRQLAGRPLDEASTGAAASYSEEEAGGKVLQPEEEAAFMAASLMAKAHEKNEL